MTQLTYIPAEHRDRNWLGFTPATAPAQAAARYTERYGAAPAYIITVPNTVLVGPCPPSSPSSISSPVMVA